MKDLDFDELDKAVNSLMATGSDTSSTSAATDMNQAQASSSPVEKDTTLTTPLSPIESNNTSSGLSPVVNTESVTREQVESTPPRSLKLSTRSLSTPSMPTKRSGRFMDVVHPSSDMTKGISAPPTRQGSTLSPVNSDVIPETAAPIITTPSIQSATAVSSPTFESSTPSPVAADEWPDPLDLHAQTSLKSQGDTKKVPEQTTTQGLLEPMVSDAPVTVEKESSTASSNPVPASPFLTDAKVEKRPLGGTNLVTPDDTVLTTEGLSPQTDPSDQVAPVTSLPAELHNDLLQIESDADKHEALPAESDAIMHSDMKSTTTPIVNQQTGPISIAQQYKQQPRTGDQSHVAVYDNAAQPLVHPAKQKSGWLITIIIVIVILVGGGGAAALFYLGYV